MTKISSSTFFCFHSSELKKVKRILRSHEGLDEVKTALIDFIAKWNDKEWIDWEKIEMVLRDLNRVRFWRMLPYRKFLVEAESKVSVDIIDVLRKQLY